MDAAKALHRLAAFHEGVGVDLVCQLCLVDVDVEVDVEIQEEILGVEDVDVGVGVIL